MPTDYQGRVLSWGIFGAMAMRALMVLAGVEAIENFKAVLLVCVLSYGVKLAWARSNRGTQRDAPSFHSYRFAGILVFTSVKLLQEDGEEEGDEDLSDNAIVKMTRSMITTVDYYDGNKFFTEVSELLVGWSEGHAVSRSRPSITPHTAPLPSHSCTLYI